MNLPQFIKYADELAAEMTEDQLKLLIHEIARTLPEKQRNQFIKTLKSIANDRSPNEKTDDQTADAYTLLRRDIEKATEFLNAVNDGQYSLDSEIDYEYADWDAEGHDNFEFSDPEDILPKIEDSIALLDRCIDLTAYKEGVELAGILLRLDINAEGDYEDYDGTPLRIVDLYEEELLEGSIDDFVKKALFLVYTGSSMSYRPAFLYNYMCGLDYVEIKLEDIMQLGDQDLPEFDEFLPLWIDYLGQQNGITADKLLDEALSMAGDEQYLAAAQKFANTHPKLYRKILQTGISGKNDAQMMNVGLEALENISDLSVLRGEIALLTADYANNVYAQETAEFCWLEAFRSDISVENYLRLKFFLSDYDKYAVKIRNIYEDFRKATSYERADHNKTYCAILFFEKRFDETMKKGLNVEKALGWTYTFMKEGIALFLLLLFHGSKLPVGLQTMRSVALEKLAFNTEKFMSGTTITDKKDPEAIFWDLFDHWKSRVDFSGEEYDRWMDTIGDQIEKRIVGIMQANRRNYYGECAAFIAAYGEVLESHGVPHGKARTMESYRAKYPRRSSFISALQSYGM